MNNQKIYGEVVILKKPTGATTLSNVDDGLRHIRESSANYGTLCGIGEEEFGEYQTLKLGELTCPQCLSVVRIIKSFLKIK